MSEAKKEISSEFKGKYSSAIGRRKTATARVRLYKKGSGLIVINGQKINDYLVSDIAGIIKQPLKLVGSLKEFDISAHAQGGGKKSQAEAIRHGLARILVQIDESYKPGIKAKDWLTRDARRKERKKPGLKKARRAPQWSKR